jgi:signal transduction histidine kinase/ligand-binding sensor domain-containing protein
MLRFAARFVAIAGGLLAGVFALGAWAGEPAAPDGTAWPSLAAATYGPLDGLPDLVIMALHQTRDGFLWIGTDSGVARFDGAAFTTFRAARTPELGHDLIRCFAEDVDGTLWIGTQAGISRYRDGRFDRPVPLATPVSALAVDRKKQLWIGTRSQGLWRFADGKLTDFSGGLRGASNLYVRALCEDSAGRMWAGLASSGPLFVDGDHLSPLPDVPRVYPGTSGFAETKEGLWFATGPDVYRWRDGQLAKFGREHGLTAEPITSIAADSAGRILVAARTLYARPPDGATFTPVPIPEVDLVRQLLVDREGGYWLGTAGFGAVRLTETAFSFFAGGNLDGAKPATAAFDPEGNAFLSFAGKGVVRLGRDGARETLRAPGAPDPSDPPALLLTRDGHLWVGRRDGLQIWFHGTATVHHEIAGAHTMYQDQHGDVWIGTENAILRSHDGQFEKMNQRLGLRDGATCAAFAESGGTLHIGLRSGGLAEWNGETARLHSTEAGATIDLIRSLQAERDGFLWIGTRDRGLVLYRDGQIWNPPELSEIFQGYVSVVTRDGFGHLFVGSSRGLFWANASDVLAVAQGQRRGNPFIEVAEAEGIKRATVGWGVQPSGGARPDGQLWFATRSGIVFVDPARLHPLAAPSAPMITAAAIGERTVVPGGPLELPVGTENLRIDFTAPFFRRPDLVRFRYRLVNQDSGWVDAGARRSAFYSHLPPGSYRFELVALTSAGAASATPASLTIVQRPHYYQTPWFRFTVAAALATLLGVGVRAWTRRKFQQRLAAWEAERRLNEERGRIARDLHDELGTSVTKIGYLVDRLEQQRGGDDLRTLQEKLSTQTRRLATDLDRVVWTVSRPHATVASLAAYLGRFTRSYFHGTEIRCEVRADPAIPALPIAPDVQHHILAVTKEAINNCAKHAHARQVAVAIDYANETLAITIADDGRGFDPAAVDPERNGLSNMRARCADMRARLGFETAPDRGTRVRLEIPIAAPRAESI